MFQKKAMEVVVMAEKIHDPLTKVLYFFYNSASFIPAWTTTGSILLFNWQLLCFCFYVLFFLLHYFFFQFQHGILEFEWFKTSLFSLMTFGCNIFQLFTTMLLDQRKLLHVSLGHPEIICFKKCWNKCMNAPCWISNIIRYA